MSKPFSPIDRQANLHGRAPRIFSIVIFISFYINHQYFILNYFKHFFDASYLNQQSLDNDKLVSLAFNIDDVVNNAVAEYSINPAEIENAISMKLLPMLFADLGLENAQKMIESVLKRTRLGLSQGQWIWTIY